MPAQAALVLIAPARILREFLVFVFFFFLFCFLSGFFYFFFFFFLRQRLSCGQRFRRRCADEIRQKVSGTGTSQLWRIPTRSPARWIEQRSSHISCCSASASRLAGPSPYPCRVVSPDQECNCFDQRRLRHALRWG